MQGVTIVDHPLVQHKLSLLREKELSTKSFRDLARELGILLCYELTRDLPLDLVEIDTPMSRMKAPMIAGKKLVFAPILRAGLALVDGMLELVPTARVAHIGLYRDPDTLVAGRVLSEDASRPCRPRRDRRVLGCRHRQHRGRRHRPAQGTRRDQYPRRLPGRGTRGHRTAARHPSGRVDMDRRGGRSSRRRCLHRSGHRRRWQPRLRHRMIRALRVCPRPAQIGDEGLVGAGLVGLVLDPQQRRRVDGDKRRRAAVQRHRPAAQRPNCLSPAEQAPHRGRTERHDPQGRCVGRLDVGCPTSSGCPKNFIHYLFRWEPSPPRAGCCLKRARSSIAPERSRG